MQLNEFYNICSELNESLDNYFNKLPNNFEPDMSLIYPTFSLMSEKEKNNAESELWNIRKKLITIFLMSNSQGREHISAQMKTYNILNRFMNIKAKQIEIAHNPEQLLFDALILISIKNLNTDIRNLILYMNSLNNIANELGINFRDIVKKVISMSSNKAEFYSISMKEFFENFIQRKPIPIDFK